MKRDPYADVKKVISITIAYFDLGQGEDYVYHGTNVFHGIHRNDVLVLAEQQQVMYHKQSIAVISTMTGLTVEEVEALQKEAE